MRKRDRSRHVKQSLSPNSQHEEFSIPSDIPIGYQNINDFYANKKNARPLDLRVETYRRIETITKRPLICYIAKTYEMKQGMQCSIDDSDITGFNDLVNSVIGNEVDVLIVSNGGSPETAERIVCLLREKFSNIRFIVPGNAYSAATLICLSGESILMEASGTLGPIDPQIGGIPARTILRAFEQIEERVKDEGPEYLAAYLPLVAKLDLYIIEICKSFQALSEELARKWLSQYMLKCPANSEEVDQLVKFLSTYDVHKSHSRSIGRQQGKEVGLRITFTEEIEGLSPLIRSLYNQYCFWFDRTAFTKLFENAHGISWGRQYLA